MFFRYFPMIFQFFLETFRSGISQPWRPNHKKPFKVGQPGQQIIFFGGKGGVGQELGVL